ncbi:hypothetical protein CXQ81_17520 [Pseudomonas sp. 09C 129]|nr:hypothetical protein CXQ81_17520 [Pseudomonas sp. 09C 129]
MEIIKLTVLGEYSFDPPFIKFIQWVKKDVNGDQCRAIFLKLNVLKNHNKKGVGLRLMRTLAGGDWQPRAVLRHPPLVALRSGHARNLERTAMASSLLAGSPATSVPLFRLASA